MVKDWRETGEESPADKAKLAEGVKGVEELHQKKIDERQKAAQVKPTHPVPLRNESSE